MDRAPVVAAGPTRATVSLVRDLAANSAGADDGIADAVHHWLGQPPEVLFDAEVYGWLGQILGEQGVLDLNRSTAAYFPPILPPDPDVSFSKPQLSLDAQTQLPRTVQTMAVAIGVAPPNCDGMMMASYFTIGWETITTDFPVIHEPTFNINSVPPVFLLSIIVCGAAFSSNAADRAVALQLQPVVRALAAAVRCSRSPRLTFQAPLYDPNTRLVLIQSFLFCAIAGELLDSEEQHHAQGLVGHALTVSAAHWISTHVPVDATIWISVHRRLRWLD